MSFMNVGPWELSVILIIAILMIGPKRMVEIVRAIGRISARLRKISNEFMGTVQAELGAVEEETRQVMSGSGAPLPAPLTNVAADIRSLGREVAQIVSGTAADVENVVVAEQRAVEEERDGRDGHDVA